jgi:hypothetical protein
MQSNEYRARARIKFGMMNMYSKVLEHATARFGNNAYLFKCYNRTVFRSSLLTAIMPKLRKSAPHRSIPYLHAFVPPIAEGAASRPDTAPATDVRNDTRTVSRQGVGVNRSDIQTITAYDRGSKALALSIAGNPLLRQQAHSRNVSDAFAASSKNARDQKVKSWIDIATAAGYQEPLRLTPDKVHTVSGILRDAGYRSTSGYLSIAKQEHTARYGDLDDQTLQAITRASRAARRGLGPAKHTRELPFKRLPEIPPWFMAGRIVGAPLQCRSALIIGSWYLMREIELAAASRSDITLVERDQVVELYLPTQKTDAEGAGCTRRLMCTCQVDKDLCPFHTIKSQVQWLDEHFPPNLDPPLFPADLQGNRQTKAGFTAIVQEVCVLLGLPTATKSGASMVTGHVCRKTGAIYLAAAGVDVWRIQLHARWGSSTVLLYIEEAPTHMMATLSVEATSSPTLQTMLKRLTVVKDKVTAGIAIPAVPASGSAAGAQLMPALLATDLQESRIPSNKGPQLPQDGDELVLNLRARGGPKLHSLAGRPGSTRCGWKFSKAPAETTLRTSKADEGTMCADCFNLRATVATGIEVSGSSSESS